MLRWRITLGILFVGLLIALFWAERNLALPVSPLFITALLVSLLAVQEVAQLLARIDIKPVRNIIYGGTLLIVASNAVPLYLHPEVDHSPWSRLAWPCGALGIGVMLAFLGEMARYEKPGRVMVHVAATMLVFMYVGLLFSFLIQLSVIDPQVQTTAVVHFPQYGYPPVEVPKLVASGAMLFPLISMLIVVKLGDIGAYTVGRLFGKHKMAPVLSPGKTLEGAGGALLFAALGSLLAFGVLAPQLFGVEVNWSSWPRWIVYGLAIGGLGIFGDLAESLFKRDVGAKDSSNWMPGFGGVLDILDSPLFVAPLAFFFWASGWLYL